MFNLKIFRYTGNSSSGPTPETSDNETGSLVYLEQKDV